MPSASGVRMIQEDTTFRTLMQGVLTGSESATQQLLRDYEKAILTAVRSRLSKNIRSKFDSLDFAQDVWTSFFRTLPDKTPIDTPGQLVALLTTMARNKVVDATRKRLNTEKYDVMREQSLDDSRSFNKDLLPGGQATPSQITMGKEEWLNFLRSQPPVCRRILILLREGQSSAEIAKELGLSTRTVQRVMGRFTPRQS